MCSCVCISVYMFVCVSHENNHVVKSYKQFVHVLLQIECTAK